MSKRTAISTLLILLCLLCLPKPGIALTANSFVSEKEAKGSFCLFAKGKSTAIYVSTNESPGVIRVVTDLQKDVQRVSGRLPALERESGQLRNRAVLVGELGKGGLVDQLVRDGKLDVSEIKGKWEACVLQVVQNPLTGVESALVIAGSDKRGTIYGVYDLSEQMGVSPWHWWADVPARHHDALYVSAGRHVQGPPAVKYRGIFINDEEPAFGEHHTLNAP